MTNYERVRNLLADRPFLIADGVTGRVRLADREAVFRAMAEGEFPSAVILNAGEALKRFVRLRGVGEGDREFGAKDIATIAGVSHVAAWMWADQGVLTPSVRDFGGSGTGDDCEARYSLLDAFTAGCLGTLRRHGLKLDVLRKVQPLFKQEKKRTEGGRQPASRS